VIKEWFLLVDDDGSGTLEHHELLAALQVQFCSSSSSSS
jgi:Ca2+-binding EF-hand superfamily protein